MTLTATYPADLLPAGSRMGSPISLVDVFTDEGENNLSTGFPISSRAQENDFITLWIAWGSQNGTFSIGSFYQVPGSLFTYNGIGTGVGGLYSPVYLALFTHVVGKDEAGRDVTFNWTYGGADAYFSTVARTWRHVDPVNPLGPNFGLNQSSSNASLGVIGSFSITQSNSMVDAALAFNANAALGTGAGGTTGLYGRADVGGFMPGLCLISGYLDIGYPYIWGGAVCNFNQGGTVVNGNYVGRACQLNPVQAPASPAFSTFGHSLDAAAGFPLAWAFINQPGQGTQEAWCLGRQQTGVTSNYGWWNANDNVWQTAFYLNYGPRSKIEVPPGAFVNDGKSWDLYGAVMEGALGYKTPLTYIGTFTADPAPALIVTGPVGKPTSPQPVLWTPILSAGYSEIAYKVRIFDHWQMAQPGWSPAGLLDDTTSFPDALGLGRWSAYANCTLSQGAGQFGLSIKCTATGNCSALSAPTIANVTDLPDDLGLGIFSCVPGDSLTATQRWVPGSTGRNVQTGIWFVDYLGNLIGASPTYGAAVSDAGGTTAAPVATSATVTVPTGAVGFVLVSLVTAAATNEVHYVQESAAWSAAAGGAPRATSALVAGSATSWTPSPALRGGTYYSAFARIQQTGGQINPDWESVSWYAAYNAAAVPTLTVTSDVDPVTHTPRAKITVTGHDAYQGLSAADSGFEGGVGSWGPRVGATQAISSTAHSGTSSLAVTFAVGNGSWTETTANAPIDPTSQVLTLGGWVRAVTTPRHVTLGVDWRNAAGVVTAGVSLPAVLDTTTGWTLIPLAVLTPPAGTASLTVYFDNETDAVPAPETHLLDDVTALIGPASTGGGLAGNTFANVYRLDPVTNELTLCRFGEGVPIFWGSGGIQTATVYDYDMLPNTTTFYEGQVFSPSATGP